MLLLDHVADRPAYMGNLVHADPERNLISISHGCSPTRMGGRTEPAKSYRLVHSHSAPPFSRDLTEGSGVASYVDYGDRGQPVTAASVGIGLSFMRRQTATSPASFGRSRPSRDPRARVPLRRPSYPLG
jgi:hypothetical protein